MGDPATCAHATIRKAGARWLCLDCGTLVEPGEQRVLPWRMRDLHGIPLFGLVVWAVTLPIAVLIACCLPLVHMVTGTLGILCHESGHMIVALLCGHPAIPTFDLNYGGGITHVYDRSWALLALVLGLVAYGAWRLRGTPRLAVPLVVLLGLQLLLVATGWDEPVRLAMGPGGTVLASGIFITRALTGEAEIYPGERWLYGVLGWCLLGDVLGLCWSLTHDPEAIARYFEGKPNVHNDFVRLSEDWFFVGLGTIVRYAFVISCLTPFAAIGWCFYRRGIRSS